jgi:transposase
MSKLAELSYDIEQLYIEGYSPRTISVMLDCPIDIVYDWLEEINIDTAEDTASEQDTYSL